MACCLETHETSAIHFEALFASSIGGCLAHLANQCTLSRAPIEQDLLVAMLLVGSAGIDS